MRPTVLDRGGVGLRVARSFVARGGRKEAVGPEEGNDRLTRLLERYIERSGAREAGAASGLAAGAARWVSSDESALTVRALGWGAADVYEIEILQLAQSQSNRGAGLEADAAAGLSGEQRFTVEVAGQSYLLSILADERDTNADIQGKMADAIRRANSGIDASVEEADGASYLVLRGRETGSAQEFTIADAGGGAVALTGAGAVWEASRDAVFTLNGERHTSAGNTVEIGGAVELTFRKTTERAVTVHGEDDLETAMELLKEIVRTFNKMLIAAYAQDDMRGGNIVVGRLREVIGRHADSLRGVGIAVDGDGMLSIDPAAVEDALSQGRLDALLEGEGHLWGDEFLAQAARAMGKFALQAQASRVGHLADMAMEASEEFHIGFLFHLEL